jgi:hypothetical protein
MPLPSQSHSNLSFLNSKPGHGCVAQYSFTGCCVA